MLRKERSIGFAGYPGPALIKLFYMERIGYKIPNFPALPLKTLSNLSNFCGRNIKVKAYDLCYNASMKHKLLFLICIIADLVALGLIFNLTDPVSIGFGGILIVFALIYLLCAGIFYMIIFEYTQWRARKQENRIKIDRKKLYLTVAALATAPVILIGFCSMGQFSIVQVLILAIAEFIAIFLIRRG